MVSTSSTGLDGPWFSGLMFELQAAKTNRSDNDMYDHMNNSVYSFLSVPF